MMGSGHGRRNGRIGAYGWLQICTHVDVQSQVECPCNHIVCVKKGEEDKSVFKTLRSVCTGATICVGVNTSKYTLIIRRDH